VIVPKYIKAEPGPGKSVIYTDMDGKQWNFDKGTRTWRNNNPGNLVPGRVSRRNNTIGRAGGFAIFPDYDTGHAALIDSLKNEHGNKDIDAQIKAVRKDKNGTIQAYLIEGYGWVPKSEGISLARAGKVDAVIATSPRGNLFLRARPNQTTTDNLENKG